MGSVIQLKAQWLLFVVLIVRFVTLIFHAGSAWVSRKTHPGKFQLVVDVGCLIVLLFLVCWLAGAFSRIF